MLDIARTTASSPGLSRVPRDLTDPAHGPHAIQRVLRSAVDALARATSCVPVFDRTGPVGNTGRMLARIPYDDVASSVLLARPGMVMEAHQRRHEVALWWIAPHHRLGLRDLGRSIGSVTAAVAPGFTISAVPASVPHAAEGRHVDARVRGVWMTIAAAGLADAPLLRRAGVPDAGTALVITLDLDRLVLLAKGMDDPALLDARDPAIASQMLDLEPFVPPRMTRLSPCSTAARRRMIAVG